MTSGTAILTRRLGPMARTCLELENHRRLAAFRRGRELATRRRLRESDLLIDLVERCRLAGRTILPAQLWTRVVHFVGTVGDGWLSADLGIDRTADHVSDILFAAQEVLLREQVAEQRRGPAEIIPLFGAPNPGG